MRGWVLGYGGLLGLVGVMLAALSPAAAAPLRYAGATTLQKDFMPEASRAFVAAGGVDIQISGGNTDAGLAALRAGTVELAGAGRYLSAAEKSAGLVEQLIGWDSLLVVVHRSNPVASLSREQLQAVFTGRIRNWKELGGRDQAILVVTGPEGSGMLSAVRELVLQGKPLATATITSLVVADCDQQVAQLSNAVSALSGSMVDSAEVRALRIDGVEPTSERYPLLKPLLLVTRRDAPRAAHDFVTFAAGREGQRIIAKKFVPAARR